MHFRTDISGLRAWAVLLVVLYHFNVLGMGGGFIGVDIFFVISGFLMGGILDRVMKDESRKSFWYFDFILARAQRIWPALFAMVALWMIWGWLRLGSEDYRATALEGLRALVFSSNIFYAKHADYFAAATEIRLFLHSWSLSVEWVFYLGLGLLALCCTWIGRKSGLFALCVAILSLASFAWMVWLRGQDPTEAFFFLGPRAWEMGVGVLAFYCASKYAPQTPQMKRSLELTGFFLIIAGFFLANSFGTWPGPITLLPVLGTAFILVSANEGSILTAPAPLQGLGEISYSLYLWHWPFTVAMNQAGLLDDPKWQAIGIAASLFAGIASWALIEQPTRRALSGRGRLFKVSVLVTGALAVGLFVGTIRKLDGFPGRIPEELRLAIRETSERHQLDLDCLRAEGDLKSCKFGVGAEPELLVLGDSHAGAMLGAIAESPYMQGRSGLVFAHSGCAPIFDTYDEMGRSVCAFFMDAAEAGFRDVAPSVPLLIVSRLPMPLEGENANGRRKPNPVIWVGDTPSGYSDEFRERMAGALVEGICRIGAGRKIYVMAPVPEMLTDPIRQMETAGVSGTAFNAPSLSLDMFAERTKLTMEALDAASKTCGAVVLPVQDYLCEQDHCATMKDGRFTYRDDDHLSIYGASLLTPALAPIFAQQ